MAADGNDPNSPPKEPVRPASRPHDLTGGPRGAGYVEHTKWATAKAKSNQSERRAALHQDQRQKPEPSRSGEAQSAPERKTLRTFEDRHPAMPTQDRGQLKREQSGAERPQPSDGAATRQQDHQNGGGNTGPDRYKVLKTFEDRHPNNPDRAQVRSEPSGSDGSRQSKDSTARERNQPDRYKTLKTFEDRHPGGTDGRTR